VSTVNSLFSALFMSYIERLPQLLRRQVLVLSAQQIVICKELDIGLSNLQTLFLHISAGEDVVIRKHSFFYQLANILMQKMQETYLKTIAEPSVDVVKRRCPTVKS